MENGKLNGKFYEEVCSILSPEQRNVYMNFINTIRESGVVYQAELEKVDKILTQQYKAPNQLERYPEFFAKNINSVIDEITKVRNDAINGKKNFRGKMSYQYYFEQIDKGLDILKKYIETKVYNYHYNNSIGGPTDLKLTLPRIDKLKSQLSQDMIFYQGYLDEKKATLLNYRLKKQQYDSLSLFGKFAARINGRKKELKEAKQKTYYYNDGISIIDHQPGDIVNPRQYDEYLQEQQPEQSTGGMKR